MRRDRSATAEAGGRRCARRPHLPRPPRWSSAGWPTNTLTSYRRDLRRYAAVPGRGRASTDLDEVTRGDRVSAFLVAPARGRRRAPAAERDLGGPDGRGGARASTSSRSRDGLATVDPAAAVKPPDARPSGCPRRCRSPTSRRSSRPPGAPGTTLALRDRALLEVLYGTGARISEAVGLDVDDLDLVDGTVLLRGKGSKERLVPVGSYAREAVDAYLVRGRPGAGRPTGDGARRRAVPQRPRRPALAAVAPGRCWSRPPTGPASPATSRRTRCGTRSPPTCSTAAPTSAWSRSCSGTPR